MSDAIVVGSGPNGMSAAVALAVEGVRVTVLEANPTIGGGTRTEELTLPGLKHDVGSAVHPLGVASPFLQRLPLAEVGLRWRHPEIALAHPLEDGPAAVMHQSLDRTAEGLGADGPAWRQVFGPLADDLDTILQGALEPVLQVPRHPLAMARLGLRAALPATVLARRFRTDAARALWAGSAAHAVQPLGRPLTSAAGAMLTAAGHAVGWPVAEGGSRAITDALAALLRRHGGTIRTDTPVTRWAQVADADLVLFDLAPGAVARIMGRLLPTHVRRAYERYRHGPAAFKVDLAVEGGIPWTDEACRRAGTVHVGGSFDEVVAAEADVAAGRMPERPFVLLAQQHLADPTRSVGDVHPVWAYAHVPNGWTGDATEQVIDQIARFAPGVRDRIVARHVRGPAQIETWNPNYVGGDIATGAADPVQVLLRPRPALDPYATGVPGVFICSAATPPGAGTHAMCGANAAASALRHLERGGRRRRLAGTGVRR